MTGWQAIIPLNLGRDCKTRLAGCLSHEVRERLVTAMARHVIDQIRQVPGITKILVLSPAKPGFADVTWREDLGRGLNQELASALLGGRSLIIHADLPLLKTGDVAALLAEAGKTGAAIAPDRAGTGTNALALTRSEGFTPLFGEGSFALHRAALPRATIVERVGLMIDIDTPEDLELALKSGAGAIACPI